MASFTVGSDTLRRAAEAVRPFTRDARGQSRYICLDVMASGARVIAGGPRGAGMVSISSDVKGKTGTGKFLLLPSDFAAVTHCEAGKGPCKVHVSTAGGKITFKSTYRKVTADMKAGDNFPDFAADINKVTAKASSATCQIDGNVVEITGKIISAISNGQAPRVSIQNAGGAAAVTVGAFKGYIKFKGKRGKVKVPGVTVKPSDAVKPVVVGGGMLVFSVGNPIRMKTAVDPERRYVGAMRGRTGGKVYGRTQTAVKKAARAKFDCKGKECKVIIRERIKSGKKPTPAPPPTPTTGPGRLDFKKLKTPLKVSGTVPADKKWKAAMKGRNGGTVYGRTIAEVKKKARAKFTCKGKVCKVTIQQQQGSKKTTPTPTPTTGAGRLVFISSDPFYVPSKVKDAGAGNYRATTKGRNGGTVEGKTITAVKKKARAKFNCWGKECKVYVRKRVVRGTAPPTPPPPTPPITGAGRLDFVTRENVVHDKKPAAGKTYSAAMKGRNGGTVYGKTITEVKKRAKSKFNCKGKVCTVTIRKHVRKTGVKPPAPAPPTPPPSDGKKPTIKRSKGVAKTPEEKKKHKAGFRFRVSKKGRGGGKRWFKKAADANTHAKNLTGTVYYREVTASAPDTDLSDTKISKSEGPAKTAEEKKKYKEGYRFRVTHTEEGPGYERGVRIYRWFKKAARANTHAKNQKGAVTVRRVTAPEKPTVTPPTPTTTTAAVVWTEKTATKPATGDDAKMWAKGYRYKMTAIGKGGGSLYWKKKAGAKKVAEDQWPTRKKLTLTKLKAPEKPTVTPPTPPVTPPVTPPPAVPKVERKQKKAKTAEEKDMHSKGKKWHVKKKGAQTGRYFKKAKKRDRHVNTLTGVVVITEILAPTQRVTPPQPTGGGGLTPAQLAELLREGMK